MCWQDNNHPSVQLPTSRKSRGQLPLFSIPPSLSLTGLSRFSSSSLSFSLVYVILSSSLSLSLSLSFSLFSFSLLSLSLSSSSPPFCLLNKISISESKVVFRTAIWIPSPSYGLFDLINITAATNNFSFQNKWIWFCL
ncbi:unnamed protein product [Prunus brigantina]